VHLILLVIWSSITLLGVIYNKILPMVFCCAIYFFIATSLLYMGIFYFVSIPDFEPFEFVYVMNDMAMYGLLMGILSLVVGRENINGVMRWKLND